MRSRPALLRAARYAAYSVAALVILLVGAALLVPLFLNTPAVQRELQSKLSGLVHGEVAWEGLSIRLLPSPRGALSKVKVEIPGVADAHAEQVGVRLRLLPLFRGRAEIASVSLAHPVVRLEIAASAKAPPREQARTSPVESYRSVVNAIRQIAPDAEIDVEDGEIEIAPSGMPPVRTRRLEVHGRTGSNGASIELTAAGEAWSERLPGPVRLASASVHVTADAVKIERAEVAMLDARALGSATIGFGKNLRIEGTVSEGSVGENLLAWVWQTVDAPAYLKLKTPVGIAVQRASWAPKKPLDLAATASFDSGPSVAVDLAWTPKALDIRRAAIKDAKSDAALALHLEGDLGGLDAVRTEHGRDRSFQRSPIDSV